jgi:glutamate-ammonia-ligase adenylyltransferase
VRPFGGSGKLARYGFSDIEQVQWLLRDLLLWDPDAQQPAGPGAAGVLTALAGTADPDLALRTLHRLAEAADDVADCTGGPTDDGARGLLYAIRTDAVLRDRLIAVLGASSALGDHLCLNPGDWRTLALDAVALDRIGPDQYRPGLLAAAGRSIAELRSVYRRHLLAIAALDLVGTLDVTDVADRLSDLADATLAVGIHRAKLEVPDTDRVRLAVIAMGKLGGQELNYVSDVDVIYVAEPVDPADDLDVTLRIAAAWAGAMMRICRDVAWPVDAALRPEGKDGPLVRTLASHQSYYHRWAKTWEFQALLKARPAAGDLELGAEWRARIEPLIWRAADREGVVEEVRAMRRRVEDHLPTKRAAREVKLGPGGLRDIEFAVQLLQLVHGRGDETLRSPATLAALAALTDGGYVGRADGEALGQSYRFLRTIEHRLQLQRLRRTHEVPADPVGERWLARSMPIADTGVVRGDLQTPRPDPVATFMETWQRHRAQVRRLKEKLFYRPLLEAVAKVPGEVLRLGPQQARERLEVLGFANPAGALRHIEALTAGVSRTAAIQRALLPTLLPVFADAADPDAGLLAYRTVSEKLGSTPWYLRFLRDEGTVAARLARLLGTSRYVVDLLGRDPEALQLLAGDETLQPIGVDRLREAMRAAVDRYVHDEPTDADPMAAVAAVRALRRRELLRTASADLLGLIDVDTVGRALSDVTDATLGAALEVARRVVGAGRPLPMRMSVIAMGRLGGREIGYASDADVLFVYQAEAGADEKAAADAAHGVAEELRRLLSAPAPDPPLEVDASLRPEGRQGPLVRSLASYAAYYERWASVWEAQALLRARPVAGDPDLGRRFVTLIDPVRYPAGGLAPEQVLEIRRIKARVDNERLPRGADPLTHTKLGRGGLSDIEWTVQLLQLRHGDEIRALRTPSTLGALAAAAEAGVLDRADAVALAAAWRLATRVRNATMLCRGRPSNQLPRRGRDLNGVVRVLDRPSDADPGEFVDEYLRTARRARGVVVRVFGG